jgi:hypothetical protein
LETGDQVVGYKKRDKFKTKIESKRVSKAENFIESEFFLKGDQLDLTKMGQIMFLIRWGVFMYTRKFQSDKANLEKICKLVKKNLKI